MLIGDWLFDPLLRGLDTLQICIQPLKYNC